MVTRSKKYRSSYSQSTRRSQQRAVSAAVKRRLETQRRIERLRKIRQRYFSPVKSNLQNAAVTTSVTPRQETKSPSPRLSPSPVLHSHNRSPSRSRNTCKERPERSKGSGGSRNYVPWCSRRK